MDRRNQGSDGGLGEGDAQVVVFSQVVVVELDETFYGLFHRTHLDQSHLVVLPERETNRLTFKIKAGWSTNSIVNDQHEASTDGAAPSVWLPRSELGSPFTIQ